MCQPAGHLLDDLSHSRLPDQFLAQVIAGIQRLDGHGDQEIILRILPKVNQPGDKPVPFVIRVILSHFFVTKVKTRMNRIFLLEKFVLQQAFIRPKTVFLCSSLVK